MAESILRSVAAHRFGAYSAGCASRDALDPDVLEFLRLHHMPIHGLRAKTLASMHGPSAPNMDFIITLCDAAAQQDFSTWPGHPFVAHWHICDEDDGAMHAELRDYFWTLMRRIKIFASLPHGKLSRRALERRALTLQPSYL